MAEVRQLRVLLTDGREFTVEADSYHTDSGAMARHGPGSHLFRIGGKDVCVVLPGKLAAVIHEDSLKGEVSAPDLDRLPPERLRALGQMLIDRAEDSGEADDNGGKKSDD